ncbi:hypothetical protein [Akkermansia sp.]|uniref:hypothetical protein n=1 Tax=Akkermansia sp. TaxID=1872421 RepID=UPI0025BA0F14|nr:hypothetical protein [Akkermansia sp.]
MAEMKTVAPWRFLLAGQELSFPCPLSVLRQNRDFHSGIFLDAGWKYFSGRERKILKIGLKMNYF